MKLKLTFIAFVIAQMAYSQSIDSIYVSSDSCDACATIYMRFYMANTGYFSQTNFNQTISGNTITIQPSWDTIYTGCFIISDYRDTTLTICNLQPDSYTVNCKSECYVIDWMLPTTQHVNENRSKVFDKVTCTDENCFVPNCFTPNADGENDTFIPTCTNFISSEFVIYDRWGNQLFFTNEKNKGWDGRMKNNTIAQEGTYYYTLKVKKNSGGEEKIVGFLTLIR